MLRWASNLNFVFRKLKIIAIDCGLSWFEKKSLNDEICLAVVKRFQFINLFRTFSSSTLGSCQMRNFICLRQKQIILARRLSKFIEMGVGEELKRLFWMWASNNNYYDVGRLIWDATRAIFDRNDKLDSNANDMNGRVVETRVRECCECTQHAQNAYIQRLKVTVSQTRWRQKHRQK